MPAYRLGTPDAAHDRARADAALGALASLEPDPGFVPKFPLPVPPRTLIDVMLPHLRQIRAYAQFRIDLEELRQEWKRGLAKEQLGRLLNEIWKPIPEYNTWVGNSACPKTGSRKPSFARSPPKPGSRSPSPAGSASAMRTEWLNYFRTVRPAVETRSISELMKFRSSLAA